MEGLTEPLIQWGRPVLIAIAVTWLGYWLLSKTFISQPNNRLFRQLAYVALFSFAFLLLVALLPINTQTKDYIFEISKYALPAVIALSSTTFVANAMAGLSLKMMGTFHTGDFIHVGDHFGRITTKALLHTEIQSEDRDLVSLPNLYVINNPVKVVDQTGTLISADLSLGFDLNRRRARDLLIKAAEDIELTDPFVHIMEIGDFSVRYRITGFLKDVSKIVSKRSELKAAALDALHEGNVEVMTPSVMAQRPMAPDARVLPPRDVSDDGDADSGQAEKLMFDKAELAARIEKFREQVTALEAQITGLRDDGAEANAMEIAWREHQVKALRDLIDRFDNKDV